MKEFTVFQIITTRKDSDYINAHGWAGLTHAGMEHFQVKQDLTFDGADAWHPDHFLHYHPVLGVHAEDLDDVFHKTNVWDDEGAVSRIGERAHSTSVGDVILDVEADVYYIVDNFGFKEIQVNDKEYV